MKEFLSDLHDEVASFVARHLLPRRVVYWAAIHLMTYASTVHATKEMDALTPADCLKAWRSQ